MFSLTFIPLLFFLSYLNKQNISKFSLTVNSSNNILLFCGQIPRIFLKLIIPVEFVISEPTSFVLILYFILPSVASINPLKIEIKVLFPAPFSPNNPKISFSYKLNDNPFKTWFSE